MGRDYKKMLSLLSYGDKEKIKENCNEYFQDRTYGQTELKGRTWGELGTRMAGTLYWCYFLLCLSQFT